MRILFYLTAAFVLVVILGPPSCRRVRQHVVLSLIQDSERPIEIVSTTPPVFRFPPTDVRAAAIVNYDDARGDAHVSFVPPDGSPLYAWAAGVCPIWTAACLDSLPPRTLTELRYGEVPTGMHQIEPTGGPPAPLERNRLYGLALFGTRLFALKAFYLDDSGAAHLMDGTRFAESVVHGRRDALRAFVDTR